MRASKLPSPALVVACLALVIALSGAGYAAVKLPRNSVGTVQLKNNAVVSAKVKNGSLRAADLANGAVTPAKLQPPGAFTSVGFVEVESCAFAPPGSNAWFTVSLGTNIVSYYRDPLGTVWLRGGALKCGTAPDTVFILPVGYRPELVEIQLVPHSTGGSGRVHVIPDGQVHAFDPPASNTSISLDGIAFRCGPSGSNGCP